MTGEIKTVSVTSIDENPWRLKGKYPLKPQSVAALVRSIRDVGFWEGVIVRKKGSRYEMAFGHHRLAAAKKAPLARIPVIVRRLTDEQMLQFMGRENGEDYNTEFLQLLNTWEAAFAFLQDALRGGRNPQPIDIARLLGWTRPHRTVVSNNTANACHAAMALIDGGHLAREDLEGLSVKSARTICQRVLARHEQIEKIAKHSGRSAGEITQLKKQVAKAAKSVAKEVLDEEISTKDIGREIDFQTHISAQREKGPRVLAAEVAFAGLANQIEKMVANDSVGQKLDQIVKSLQHVRQDQEATRALGRVAYELKCLRQRVSERERAIRQEPKAKRGAKVVPLRAIAGGE